MSTVTMLLAVLLSTLLITVTQCQYNGKLPNIVFMLTDDLGWNSMYHNSEQITPTLDSMVSSSLLLNSFYVYKYCSPTRGSFQTGRFPYKLCASRNNLNPPTIPEGINLGYTFIPEKLKESSPPYISYHVGKWHQGFYNLSYTPIGRGYNKSYGFLTGGEDHFNQHQTEVKCNPPNPWIVDLHDGNQPAFGKNGTYNGYKFTQIAIEFIENHVKTNKDNPFFLYYPLHNTHGPYEAPNDTAKLYNFNETLRNTFDAMVTIVDESVENVTNTLKSLNLWDNTLFIWTTDNGVPVQGAGSNYPLRGSKSTNWEGGVHVPALVSGGILPNKMRGKQLNGLMHITDWYSTFCYLAGDINPNDNNPNSPSPIDSLNMWPYLSGKVFESPRNLIVHDHRMYTDKTQGAIRNGKYKLMIMNESAASWYGQFTPNQTWNKKMMDVYACSINKPCLFDIENDPTEHNDISNDNPEIVKSMVELFHSFDNEHHPPKNHPAEDTENYCNAISENKDFIVSWLQK